MIRFAGLGGIASLVLTGMALADNIVDYTDPVSVTAAVFTGAQSESDRYLSSLCDPKGENDGDTQEYICDNTVGGKNWDEYVRYFAKGSVVGDAVIKGKTAKVPILVGPDGTKKDTMNLVMRDGGWFLSSF